MLNGLLMCDGYLRVERELNREFDLEFDQACNELLKFTQNELTIDFRNCTYVNSTYIGIIAATYYQAKGLGKNLRIIATNPVLNIFRTIGFEGLIELESVYISKRSQSLLYKRVQHIPYN